MSELNEWWRCNFLHEKQSCGDCVCFLSSCQLCGKDVWAILCVLFPFTDQCWGLSLAFLLLRFAMRILLVFPLYGSIFEVMIQWRSASIFSVGTSQKLVRLKAVNLTDGWIGDSFKWSRCYPQESGLRNLSNQFNLGNWMDLEKNWNDNTWLNFSCQKGIWFQIFYK